MRTVDRRTDNPRRPRNWFGCTDDMPLWARPDVLTFSTEPLDEAVEVVGDIRVVLYASPRRSTLIYGSVTTAPARRRRTWSG